MSVTLQHQIEYAMTDKKPFDKEQSIKIPFSELVELINQKCDYRFAIIDNEVDEELMFLAKNKSLAFQSLRKRKAPE